jgi:L-aminopeptidase/D-esterase-like protein
MQEVHALLLTGGSAFGLSAADGVMRWLEEQHIGYQTPWAKVPIVPAAVIFDLNIGSPGSRPGAEAGYAACRAATPSCAQRGNIGAGTGATVGKWAGVETRMKGGLGATSVSVEGVTVTVVSVVNAVGDILDESSGILAGARSADGRWLAHLDPSRTFAPVASRQTNTTLIAIMTNAKISKVDANRVAQRAHDGMARAIKPVHTSFDGDLSVVLAAGEEVIPLDFLAELAADAASHSIRDAVRNAASLAGAPGLRG